MGRRSKRRAEQAAPAQRPGPAAPALRDDELAPPKRHHDWALLAGLVLWAPSAYRWVGGDLSGTAAGVRLAAALAFALVGLWALRTLVAGYLPPPPEADEAPEAVPVPADGPPQRRRAADSADADADADPFAWNPPPEPQPEPQPAEPEPDGAT